MYKITNEILSIITSIKTDKEMINLDKRNDGTWRLIFSEKTIGDITRGSNIKVTIETELGVSVFESLRKNND